MRHRSAVLFLAFCVVMMSGPTQAQEGQIYQCTDKDGNTVFKNTYDPSSAHTSDLNCKEVKRELDTNRWKLLLSDGGMDDVYIDSTSVIHHDQLYSFWVLDDFRVLGIYNRLLYKSSKSQYSVDCQRLAMTKAQFFGYQKEHGFGEISPGLNFPSLSEPMRMPIPESHDEALLQAFCKSAFSR